MNNKNLNYEIELIINERLFNLNKISSKMYKKTKEKLLKLNKERN